MPWLIVSTLFFGSLAVLLLFFINPKTTSFLCGVIWARLNAYLTPMLVKVAGKNNIDKKQSYIIVSNHQSHYDIFVLYGWLGVDFKWVMKQELRKIPALGAACERIGHIFIDRSNHETAMASINAAKKKIVNGTSLLLFPEGTRSMDGKIGNFKKGAFRLAVDLGLPILPITIIGTKDILPAKNLNLFPGTARMIIHKPVALDQADDNLERLMETTREIIKSGLETG